MVGVGGCYVDALTPFPEGTLVKLRIVRDQAPFKAAAKWFTPIRILAWALLSQT